MLEEQLIKAAKGLAMIIPAILLLRWFLTRKTGNPEEWAEYHIQELKTRYAQGEIDEAAYNKRLDELSQE
jgi:putative membrane protein